MKKTYDLCRQYMSLVEAFCDLYVVACHSIPDNDPDGKSFRVLACDGFKEVTGLDLEQSVNAFLSLKEHHHG